MHSAEVAVAKAQAAADGKREAEKEVAEIKKNKDFRERNEEVYKLALELAEKAREMKDYRTAATCLAQAVAATAQIKPLTDSSDAKSGASAIIAYVESERAKE